MGVHFEAIQRRCGTAFVNHVNTSELAQLVVGVALDAISFCLMLCLGFNKERFDGGLPLLVRLEREVFLDSDITLRPALFCLLGR